MITGLEREATERGEPTAVGLVRVVKTYYFIASCYLLSSVLSHINRLSHVFQAKSIDLTLLRPSLSSTIEAIKGYCSAEFKDAETRISSDLSDFNIHFSATHKDDFRRNIQEKYIVAQLEIALQILLKWKHFPFLIPQNFPLISLVMVMTKQL